MAEVSEVRWHDIERIRLIDSSDSRLESLVAPAFKLMKQYLKGRWAARRHVIAPPTTAILPPCSGEPSWGARPPDAEDGWRPARAGGQRKGARSGKRREQSGKPPRGGPRGAPAKK
jgi:hypothetical protein